MMAKKTSDWGVSASSMGVRIMGDECVQNGEDSAD